MSPLTSELSKWMASGEFDSFRTEVVMYANRLYANVGAKEEQFSGKKGAVVNQWAVMMKDWFERQLPLLLSYPYSPFSAFERKWQTNSGPSDLVEAWRDNLPFMLAELDKSQLKFFATDSKPQIEPNKTLAVRRMWQKPFQNLQQDPNEQSDTGSENER